MKLTGKRISIDVDPLYVSGALSIAGGAPVQFFDGEDYVPNREGLLSSPILLTHVLDVVDPESGEPVSPVKSTMFYEDDVLITALTAGYVLVGDDSVKVVKNIPPGDEVVVKAVTKFLDKRSDEVLYERQDTILLRTLIKPGAQHDLRLTPGGVVYFDGYRNPNTLAEISAKLMLGSEEVSDFNGIDIRWLNKAGEDVVENELYGVSVSSDRMLLTVDKTYIYKERVVCEAWRDGVLIGSDSVTFARRFNSYRIDMDIIGIPLQHGVDKIKCEMVLTDTIGDIDVNSAFLLGWILREDGYEREIGTGTPFSFDKSEINLSASVIEIFPDLKRREAFAALTDDNDNVLTDDDDNVLTVETFGS